MRKGGLIFLVIMLLSLILLLISPPVLGIYLEKKKELAVLTGNVSQEVVQVKVLEYKRGWFSSNALVQVTVNDPGLQRNLIEAGLVTGNTPLKLYFKSHILHGPVFYEYTEHLPSRFGLAANSLQLIIPKEQKELFATLGIKPTFIKEYKTFLSFFGKIFNYVELGSLHLTTPTQHEFHFDSLIAKNWHSPATSRVQGESHITRFSFIDGPRVLSIPDINVEFDLREDKNGFWIGENSINLNEIVLRNYGNRLFSATHVDFSGATSDASEGLINAEKGLAIQKLQFENNAIGPFQLQISVERLNVNALNEIIQAYHTIMSRGELYESQLREKMLSLLPTVVSPGSALKLNKLFVSTQQGNMEGDAELKWPQEKNSSPDSIGEFIKDANLQARFRIAIPLVEELINFIAKTNYLEQISPADREQLIALNANVIELAQSNALMISGLNEAKLIPNHVSKELLQLLGGRVAPEFFNMRVKEFYFSKQIPLEISLLLQSNYADLISHSDFVLQEIKKYQIAAVQDTKMQLNDLIKKGYVIRGDNDYTINAVRENGIVKINGQPFPSS